MPALEAEFDEGLLNVRGVGEHGRGGGGEAGVELNFVSEDGVQNRQRFFDDSLEARGLEVGGLALGEFAEFDDEFAGAVGGLEDVGEGFAGGMDCGEFEGDDFGAAEDAGEEVVEFVRGTGGELVEGGEF